MSLIDLFQHWLPFSISHWCLLNQSHGDVVCRYLALIYFSLNLQFECHEHHVTLRVLAPHGAIKQAPLHVSISLIVIIPLPFKYVPLLQQLLVGILIEWLVLSLGIVIFRLFVTWLNFLIRVSVPLLLVGLLVIEQTLIAFHQQHLLSS